MRLRKQPCPWPCLIPSRARQDIRRPWPSWMTTSCPGTAAWTPRCSRWSAVPPEPASQPSSTRLVGHAVTRAGAIRPTTRQPILLHHPADGAWFEDLQGAAQPQPDPRHADGQAPARQPGRAHPGCRRDFLPGPRRRPAQCRRASRCWTPPTSTPSPMTTASSPASCSPPPTCGCSSPRPTATPTPSPGGCCWTQRRGTSWWPWCWTGCRRLPRRRSRADLHAMLGREGLGDARLFVVPEAALDAMGMLPAATVEPLADLAPGAGRGRRRPCGDRAAHPEWNRQGAGHAGRSGGAGRAGPAACRRRPRSGCRCRVPGCRGAHPRSRPATARCCAAKCWPAGRTLLAPASSSGSWSKTSDGFRDRMGAFFRGEPTPAVRVETAIETGLQAVILDEAANAAEDVDQRWRSDPAGRAIAGHRRPFRNSPRASPTPWPPRSGRGRRA